MNNLGMILIITSYHTLQRAMGFNQLGPYYFMFMSHIPSTKNGDTNLFTFFFLLSLPKIFFFS